MNPIELNNKYIAITLQKLYETQNNKINLQKDYNSLKNKYKIVDCNSLVNGDYIRYVNIKLQRGGIVSSVNDEYIKLFFKKNYWVIKKKDYIIFKKLNKNEIIRLNLEASLIPMI